MLLVSSFPSIRYSSKKLLLTEKKAKNCYSDCNNIEIRTLHKRILEAYSANKIESKVTGWWDYNFYHSTNSHYSDMVTVINNYAIYVFV